MRSMFIPFTRLGRLARHIAAAGLLAGTALVAHADVRWSFGVNLGFPVAPLYGPVYEPGYGDPYGYGTVTSALPVGAVSVEVGGGRYWRHGGVWYRPWGPSWVVVAPPVVVAQQAPVQAVAAVPARPDPVIYPRNGQDPQQTESDRQACNRQATTQPAALADAAVFQRAVEACMDGRGYTMK